MSHLQTSVRLSEASEMLLNVPGKRSHQRQHMIEVESRVNKSREFSDSHWPYVSLCRVYGVRFNFL